MKIRATVAPLLLVAALATGSLATNSAAWAAGGTDAVGGGGSMFQAPPGTATSAAIGAPQADPVGVPAGPSTVSPGGSVAGDASHAIQNGHDIEPAPGAVTREEKAAGVAPPPAQSQRETVIVEQQANQLIRKSQADTRTLPGSTEAR
jgi:hypothetical protein